MEDETSIAEEGWAVGVGGDEIVRVLSIEFAILWCDLSVLSREVSDLTELGRCSIADDCVIRPSVRYKMRTGCGTAAIFGDFVHMNVVCWRVSVQ
jgi:hypothetical protein